MKVKIEFEDIGAQSVAMTSEIIVSKKEEQHNKPTPAAVLALATRALYESGMLARVGQVALEGISKGTPPAEYILTIYNEKNNATNT